MNEIDSIVIEIRRNGDGGEYYERIKFLATDELRTDGVEIPLTNCNDALHIVMKDKVTA